MFGRYCCLVLALVFIGCASREDKVVVQHDEAASQLPAGNPVVGLAVYATCNTCHGDAAEGNQSLHAPALANSDDWYLYRQLTNFRKGIRGYAEQDTAGIQMSAMAKTLKDSIAIADVVAY